MQSALWYCAGEVVGSSVTSQSTAFILSYLHSYNFYEVIFSRDSLSLQNNVATLAKFIHNNLCYTFKL